MQRVKILWFTNTACSATEKLGINSISGGWLKSLEERCRIIPEIDLAICFYTYQDLLPFVYNETKYYPVRRPNMKSKFGRFLTRVFTLATRDKKELKDLIKVIDAFKPDLIHIHGTEENFGMVQEFTNIPIIISIQGILNSCVIKYFSGIPVSIASKYENLLNKLAFASNKYNYNQIENSAKREKKILMNTKYIIGRTAWDMRISRVLAPNSTYFQVDEILRTNFYTKVWEKSDFNNPVQITTISGNGFYKGFEIIVSTAHILNQFKNINFVWNVIGLNADSNVVQIVKKWKRLNLNNLNVKLFGILSENQVIDVLIDSDIFCQTSHIENSSNSLCEAMMLGLPIVANYAGGTDSIIENNKEGILIQDGDPFILAGSIYELINDFKKSKNFASSARTRALIRHNPQNILKALIEAYNYILSPYNLKIEI